MPLHGGCGNLLSARGSRTGFGCAVVSTVHLGRVGRQQRAGTAAVRLEIPPSSPSGKIPASPPALIHTATAAVFLQTSAYNYAEFEPLHRRASAGRGAAEGPSELAPFRQRLACPVDYIVAHKCIASLRQPSLRNIISIDNFVYFPAFHSAAVVTRPLTEQCVQ